MTDPVATVGGTQAGDRAPMNKTDRVVAALLEGIRSDRFAPGERLPTEIELADELDVSRSAVREAVQSLSYAGVLRVRQGGGTFVTELEPERLLRSASRALELSGPDTLAEVYAVRQILEPVATAMAASRVDADDIAVLEAELGAMRTSQDPEDFVRHDIAFHDRIAAATGNETLRALLGTLRSRAALGYIRRARSEENAEAESIAEHEAILAAVCSGDPELARATTTVHLARGQQWLETAAPANDED